MREFSLGIDVSKKDCKLCLMQRKGDAIKVKSTKTILNTEKGFAELYEWVNKHLKDLDGDLIVVMEATGVYHEKLALYLQQLEFQVSVVLPNKAKHFIKSLGTNTKNDDIDAKGLATMGLLLNLALWTPKAAYYIELRHLTRYYESLQSDKTLYRNRLEAHTHSAYQKQSITDGLNKMIDNVQEMVLHTQKAIEDLLESDADVWRKVQNITLIKGVGLLTVATILAETFGFELFESQRQLTKFSGYDVIQNQSGNHTGRTRISKKGNSHIRRILHMPSLCLVRYHVEPFHNLFERVYERTKIKMKGYVAIQRKLLILIYTLWKKDIGYQSLTLDEAKEKIEAEYPNAEYIQASTPNLVNWTNTSNNIDNQLYKNSPKYKQRATLDEPTLYLDISPLS